MVDDVGSGGGFDEAIPVVEVDAMDFNLVNPGHGLELLRRAHGDTDAMTGPQQARDEPSPDVPGGPEHQDRAGTR